MDKEQGENFLRKPKEIGIPKNPFSVGQKEENEEAQKKQFLEQGDQLKMGRTGFNLVPMIRKLPEEAGALPPDSRLSEQAKVENWLNLEKEFKNKIKVIKKGNKLITVSTVKGPTGSQHFIFKGKNDICSVTMGKDGIFFKVGPKEQKFLLKDKNDFLNRFDNFCSK